jgi:hypothetical protein
MKMSQSLGFKKFKLVKSVRKDFQAHHWRTGEPIQFVGWSQDKKFNRREEIFTVKNQVLTADCMHLSLPSVYLNANGKLNVCCEFNLFERKDHFESLPDIQQQLASDPHRICLHACGSCATIENL